MLECPTALDGLSYSVRRSYSVGWSYRVRHSPPVFRLSSVLLSLRQVDDMRLSGIKDDLIVEGKCNMLLEHDGLYV